MWSVVVAVLLWLLTQFACKKAFALQFTSFTNSPTATAFTVSSILSHPAIADQVSSFVRCCPRCAFLNWLNAIVISCAQIRREVKEVYSRAHSNELGLEELLSMPLVAACLKVCFAVCVLCLLVLCFPTPCHVLGSQFVGCSLTCSTGDHPPLPAVDAVSVFD